MAQKNATPTKAQAASIKRAGLNPKEWTVAKELVYSMFIRNRDTGAVQRIKK